MSNPNVQRLSGQPTIVLDVSFPKFPPMPPAAARLPGMKEWEDELKLYHERLREAIQRLILTKTTGS